MNIVGKEGLWWFLVLSFTQDHHLLFLLLLFESHTTKYVSLFVRISALGILRDPTRNFRFELFSFRCIPHTHLWNDRKGWVFGQISASDKFGLQISRACEVRGYIVAYYGDNFLDESQSETETISKDCYMALLFRPDPPYVLKDGDIIPLIKSMLAVPTKGSLIVKAYMEDVHSDKVIMNDCFKFKPLLNGFTSDTITGSECSLDLTASWNYLARYL